MKYTCLRIFIQCDDEHVDVDDDVDVDVDVDVVPVSVSVSAAAPNEILIKGWD